MVTLEAPNARSLAQVHDGSQGKRRGIPDLRSLDGDRYGAAQWYARRVVEREPHGIGAPDRVGFRCNLSQRQGTRRRAFLSSEYRSDGRLLERGQQLLGQWDDGIERVGSRDGDNRLPRGDDLSWLNRHRSDHSRGLGAKDSVV